MTTLNPGYQELAEAALETLAYTPTTDPKRWHRVASRLQAACEDVHMLVSSRILDLGCGSSRSKDNPPFWQWALAAFRPIDCNLPWYCRLAHFAQADVLGIDIAPNTKEPFRSLQADLTDDATFRVHPDESFDIVNSKLFTVRPDNKYGHHAFSPHLKKKISEPDDLYRYDAYVFAQVERLLCDGGRYTLMNEVYQKRNGRLEIIGKV